MSRTSFDRDDRVWPAITAASCLDQASFENAKADGLYIESDTVLESGFLETSLEDYDDLLSMAREDDLVE